MYLKMSWVQSFGIPVFLVVFDKSVDISPFIGKVERVIDGSTTNFDLYKRQIEAGWPQNMKHLCYRHSSRPWQIT